MTAELPGLIWITGFSGAGKTTVARHVEARLRASGAHVVAIDGDHLREIFGGGWGYERHDRVELAHVYFRLCRHLVDQGAVVVISAVAMFREVREWVRVNIPNSRIVYLDVPHDVRVRRDEATKHVYATGDVESIYDEPYEPDARIPNHGTVSPQDAATMVLDALTGPGVLR